MRKTSILLLTTAIALASPALAQKRGAPAAPEAAATGGVTCVDPLNKLPLGCTPRAGKGGIATQVVNSLAKPFQDLANLIGDDVEGAIALSTVVPSLQDGHGQQCLIAFKAFKEVINVHPVPLTLQAASDLEVLRLLAMAADDVCANPHCTQVMADLATGIQLAAPVNASIPIPSLHDLCAKVPQIAKAAPVTYTPAPDNPPQPAPPAPAPAPSPAPSNNP